MPGMIVGKTKKYPEKTFKPNFAKENWPKCPKNTVFQKVLKIPSNISRDP